jgi:hypothetical protein
VAIGGIGAAADPLVGYVEGSPQRRRSIEHVIEVARIRRLSEGFHHDARSLRASGMPAETVRQDENGTAVLPEASRRRRVLLLGARADEGLGGQVQAHHEQASHFTHTCICRAVRAATSCAAQAATMVCATPPFKFAR